MSNAYKPVWVIFALFLLMAGVTTVSKLLQPKEIIPWRTDFAASREEAQKLGKPLFAYFTATWCGPCVTLKHTTWADAKVDAALREYVPVKIDIDQNSDVAGQYGVESVPTFVVLNDYGRVIRFSVGAMPPEEFLQWLKG